MPSWGLRASVAWRTSAAQRRRGLLTSASSPAHIQVAQRPIQDPSDPLINIAEISCVMHYENSSLDRYCSKYLVLFRSPPGFNLSSWLWDLVVSGNVGINYFRLSIDPFILLWIVLVSYGWMLFWYNTRHFSGTSGQNAQKCTACCKIHPRERRGRLGFELQPCYLSSRNFPIKETRQTQSKIWCSYRWYQTDITRQWRHSCYPSQTENSAKGPFVFCHLISERRWK